MVHKEAMLNSPVGLDVYGLEGVSALKFKDNCAVNIGNDARRRGVAITAHPTRRFNRQLDGVPGRCRGSLLIELARVAAPFDELRFNQIPFLLVLFFALSDAHRR